MFLKMVARQAWHKRGISLLVFLAMTALVALYVYSNNTSQFANRSMQLVMKNMGHNLLILPEGTDPQSVYVCSAEQPLFPQATTREMSQALKLASRYYVSVLQARKTIEGQDLILTGVEPIARKDETEEKGNMILPLAEDEVRLGAEAARKLGKAAGQSVQIEGQPFQVIEVLPAKASLDDCRVTINLARCQEILAAEGQIHFILAFLCLHGGSLEETLAVQERMLTEGFPGFRQVSRMDIALGRHLARLTTQKSLQYLLLIVGAATVVVVAVTGLQEVHDRRHETGILIAMGMSQSYIVSAYLFKTIVLALAASVVGFLLGSALAVQFMQPFLVVATNPVTILWNQLPAAIALTCAVAAVAEVLPMLKLLSMDPNAVLAEP